LYNPREIIWVCFKRYLHYVNLYEKKKRAEKKGRKMWRKYGFYRWSIRYIERRLKWVANQSSPVTEMISLYQVGFTHWIKSLNMKKISCLLLF
jgi:hypothetical protein